MSLYLTDGTDELDRGALLKHLLQDIVNKMYLARALIRDRDMAVDFNSRVTAPLMDIRRQHGMGSGNVVKVKTRSNV